MEGEEIMPKITKSYCDICGDETNGITKFEISTGTASKKTVEHTIHVDLEVTRKGSALRQDGEMPNDEICFTCYCRIVLGHLESI